MSDCSGDCLFVPERERQSMVLGQYQLAYRYRYPVGVGEDEMG